MTSQVVDTTSELIAKLQIPPEQQQQVLDFVEFLAHKYVQPQAPKKRVMGLHKGLIWMSEDFNDPLPD